MWNEELSGSVAYNPTEALKRASDGRSVVEGLVPRGGVTWLYGPSMSFKSFITMGLAGAVSTGTPWLGRKTEKSTVVYVGAEGGDALHVRRAAAEMAAQANSAGVIVVAQERPMIDQASGLFGLRGILDGVCHTVLEVVPHAAEPSALLSAFTEYAGAVNSIPALKKVLHDAQEAAACAEDRAEAEFQKLFAEGSADELGHKLYVAKQVAAADRAVASARAALADREKRVKSTLADAVAQDARIRAYQQCYEHYDAPTVIGFDMPSSSVLCIIDTYSQTAEDDNRRSVSAYIKNLRTLIEEAQAAGVTLSFIVVDHVTKEGSTYLGSVAKLNDVDSQIEVARLRKSLLATITQTKSKDCVESPALNVEMVPFEIPGFRDAEGKPLSTLVARDGSNSAAAVALNPEGNVAMLCELLQAAEGIMRESELKAAFKQTKIAAGVKPESADKAYRRAMQALREDGGIREADGEISLA